MALTQKYVTEVLDLLTDESADFSLGEHEFWPPAEMDRALLSEMAEYIMERLNGNMEPLKMDHSFDDLVLNTLAPDDSFALKAQEARFEHCRGVCRNALEQHKRPLTSIAAAAPQGTTRRMWQTQTM